MKAFASVIALAALAAAVVPSRALAGGTIQVTSGTAVAARPVGPQPSLVVVRPTVVPLAVGRPFTLAQPLLVARPFSVTQPVVGTQPIVIGQPFVITQPGMVQQQIVVPSNGVFFTSQGLMVVVQ
ncbi:MAG TPA: hypothetical protein VF113_08745 [Stellaceae bacterium]